MCGQLDKGFLKSQIDLGKIKGQRGPSHFSKSNAVAAKCSIGHSLKGCQERGNKNLNLNTYYYL